MVTVTPPVVEEVAAPAVEEAPAEEEAAKVPAGEAGAEPEATGKRPEKK